MNEWLWRRRVVVQTWWHSRTEPLPTMTRNGLVSVTCKCRNLATHGWTKLWVLPLSTSTVSRAPLMKPYKRKVSGAERPERACKLIWGKVGEDGVFNVQAYR